MQFWGIGYLQKGLRDPLHVQKYNFSHFIIPVGFFSLFFIYPRVYFTVFLCNKDFSYIGLVYVNISFVPAYIFFLLLHWELQPFQCCNYAVIFLLLLTAREVRWWCRVKDGRERKQTKKLWCLTRIPIALQSVLLVLRGALSGFSLIFILYVDNFDPIISLA